MALNALREPSSSPDFQGLLASRSSAASDVLDPVLDSPWQLPWHLPDEQRGSSRRQLDDRLPVRAGAVREAKQCQKSCPPAESGLVHALMPVIWSLRLFLMLPVSITTVGPTQREFQFRWRSWTMAVTFVGWALLVVIAYYVVRFRIDTVMSDDKHFHLYDVVPKYASAISLCYIFFLPLTCWTTADRHVAFIHHWTVFEAEMQALLKADVSLAWLRRLSWLSCAVGVGMPVVMQGLALTTLPDESVWMVPVLLHSFIFMTLGSVFWMLCCITFSRVARYQADRLPADASRLGLRGLRAHRHIWLGMARTLQLMTASWGRIQMLLLAIAFVAFTSISFLFTHFIRSNRWDGRAVWLGAILVFCSMAICISCNSAHIASSGLRGPFIKNLLCISLLVKDDRACVEISRFLDDIRLESPVVSLGGLAVLGRSSILSVYALAVTYLVVLSQFTISSESAAVNFSEVPTYPDSIFETDI